MKYGQLRDHFRGVGAKYLSAVDAEPHSSNQHEIGTTKPMRREFLGEGPKQEFPAVYIWLGEAQDAITVNSSAPPTTTRGNTSLPGHQSGGCTTRPIR